MSYAPSSGFNVSKHSTSTALQPPTSLPARPPPPASGAFKPAFPVASNSGAPGTGSSSRSAFTAFKPRTVGATQQHASPAAAPSSSSAPPISTGSAANYGSSQFPYAQHPRYYPQQNSANYVPPKINNPFPLPGQDGGRDNSKYDPEMEAQIAQWQTAYTSKDDFSNYKSNTAVGPDSAGGANAVALGSRTTTGGHHEQSSSRSDYGTKTSGGAKQKTVVRHGGGQTWEDTSLLEWNPAHFRLFVGNLAGEVTDESLHKAFSKYDSVQKARVVRDKRTSKSKGFGFVSFSDGDQYFQAVKDMQGKYIGSHPVLLKRATTEVKPVTQLDKHKKTKGKNGGAGGHANTGAGVKKAAKTRNGLKVLG